MNISLLAQNEREFLAWTKILISGLLHTFVCFQQLAQSCIIHLPLHLYSILCWRVRNAMSHLLSINWLTESTQL